MVSIQESFFGILDVAQADLLPGAATMLTALKEIRIQPALATNSVQLAMTTTSACGIAEGTVVAEGTAIQLLHGTLCVRVVAMGKVGGGTDIVPAATVSDRCLLQQ